MALALALCAPAACSGPPAPLLASSDPAIDRYLRDQPAAYGGIARWAHQFMLVEEAVSRLAAQGFDCPAPGRDAATRTCEKKADGWTRKLLGRIRSERVVITMKHPGPRLAKVEGMRYEDTSTGPAFSEPLAAPGLSFRNARAMADFVLDTHREWHPRKLCFPSAAAPGCEEERKARGESGWPHWDGATRVAIGTALESAANLRETGFMCDSTDSLKRARATDAFRHADGHAWVDCAAVALDGQEQRVQLGLNPSDAALELLRITAGKDSVEIPVERQS